MPQDANQSQAPIYIDAKGLKCPMPVIKLQQALRPLKTGQEVMIECTDLGAEKDIASWCRVNKHEIINLSQTDFGILFNIVKH